MNTRIRVSFFINYDEGDADKYKSPERFIEAIKSCEEYVACFDEWGADPKDFEYEVVK